MFKDFKSFLTRGNAIDLAVGVIIGGAFGKIVSSFVADIIMPLIGVVSGGINFAGLSVRIGGTDTAPIKLTYGNFIQAAIDFLIIGLIVFLLVRFINSMKKPEPASPEHFTKDQQLLMEIRDELKKR